MVALALFVSAKSAGPQVRPPVAEALSAARPHLLPNVPFLVQVVYSNRLEATVLVEPVVYEKKAPGLRSWTVRAGAESSAQRIDATAPDLSSSDATRITEEIARLYNYSVIRLPVVAYYSKGDSRLLLTVRDVPYRPEGSRTYLVPTVARATIYRRKGLG